MWVMAEFSANSCSGSRWSYALLEALEETHQGLLLFFGELFEGLAALLRFAPMPHNGFLQSAGVFGFSKTSLYPTLEGCFVPHRYIPNTPHCRPLSNRRCD